MGHLDCTEKHVARLPLEVKAAGEPGAFEGYGAIFGNLDRDGDIVAKGAFADSLKAGMPALLWQHDAKQPIGRFDEVREDEKGLYVRGRLSLQGRGLEAYELLKMGALDGLSIGFVTKEASRNALTGARTIRRADLMEISLVTFPANELARVSAVKSAGGVPETKEAFIRMLTDHGMTNRRATNIAEQGFGGLSRQTDGDIAQLVGGIKARQSRIDIKGADGVTLQSGARSNWIGFNPRLAYRDGVGSAYITFTTPGRFSYDLRYWRAVRDSRGKVTPYRETLRRQTGAQRLRDVVDPALINRVDRWRHDHIEIRITAGAHGFYKAAVS